MVVESYRPQKLEIMTQCIVYDETTNDSQTFYSLTAAKKWMRERLKQGHIVNGQKYKIYSNGDMVNCGRIKLKGDNKVLIVNTNQKKAGY